MEENECEMVIFSEGRLITIIIFKITVHFRLNGYSLPGIGLGHFLSAFLIEILETCEGIYESEFNLSNRPVSVFGDDQFSKTFRIGTIFQFVQSVIFGAVNKCHNIGILFNAYFSVLCRSEGNESK